MSQLIIKGNKKLSGIWSLSGNKNEALPLIASSLLFSEGLTLTRLPQIEDVKVMLKIAEALGVEINGQGNKYTLRARNTNSFNIPPELSSKVRGSLLFLGPLLALHGQTIIPRTGGDKIGLRKIDTHLEVFKSFGAKISGNKIVLPKNNHKDVKIWLSEPSVTATENALMLATHRPIKTIIKNAASEPHVVNLGKVLSLAGAKIDGLGTNYLSIRGIEKFKPVKHQVGEDFMELGGALVISTLSGGKIKIPIDDIAPYEKIFEMFHKFGKKIIHKNGLIEISNIKQTDTGIQEISDGPWPSFPSDLMSVMLVLTTQINGQFLFHEKMFESRLYFTDQLKNLGVKLVLCDPHRVLISGPNKLHGGRLTSPDIRAGMALLIAALIAEGESTVDNIEQLDRGYENIVEKLKAVGANIVRK